MDMLQHLTQDESDDEEDNYASKKKGKSRRNRTHRSNPTPVPGPRASQQKPAEVSDNVWGLAEQFLEGGKAFFGRHIPVNRAEFAKRLAERINNDPDVRALLHPLDWNDEHRLVRTRLPEDEFTARVARVNDIVAEMMTRFWVSLEVGANNTGGLQFRFLDDDWDELWYDAVKNLMVREIVKGLDTGKTKRVAANYRQVPEESRAAHRLKRLQMRLRRQSDRPERGTLTDQDREGFSDWVAERNRSRDSVRN